jgi:biopolymer transport protein ExbB
LSLLVVLNTFALAQETNTITKLRSKLESSQKELAKTRERIADEKIPLTKELHELENTLMEARDEYEDVKRQLDRRNLDMNNLRSQIKAREEEKSYLSSLLTEYVRNLETRLHIAEIDIYEDAIQQARLAPQNSDLAPSEVFARQAGMVEMSLERLEELCGGTRFEGRAASGEGLVKRGLFLFFGPVAYFASDDGELAGMAEQKLGSMEPSVTPYADPRFAEMTERLVRNGHGTMPFDGTLGNARKVEETRETVGEHIEKGGFMMYPIISVAVITVLYSIFKLINLLILQLKTPSEGVVNRLLAAVGNGDEEKSVHIASRLKGPLGRMLRVGTDHRKEPKDLIEETMYEKMLETRQRLRGLIPFVAVAAAAAPLMGLLGTVLGIINTFKMLTVFGSGDVKQLSGGISEALITTEAGLILAIPSLASHAVLSWLTKGFTDRMERTATAFLTAVEKARTRGKAAGRARKGEKQGDVSTQAEAYDSRKEPSA